MTPLALLARELDKHSFLGLNIWDFSLHSLEQRYGKLFVQQVMLKYPFSALEGLLQYNSLVRKGKTQGEIVKLVEGDLTGLAIRIITQREESLVAVGYCQKPLDAAGQPGCPSGRFNYNCQFLESLNLAGKNRLSSPACSKCSVKAVGLQALKLGLTFHIMTTAADIALDILIPSLAQQRYKFGLFFLCPYSSEALIFPLLICHIEAYLIRYQSGNCLDYTQFIAADQGNKLEQTQISPTAWDWWQKFSQLMEQQLDQGRSSRFTHFNLQGNMLVPAGKKAKLSRPGTGRRAGPTTP